MATSIDDNAADENLYKLFGEMSVIQYNSVMDFVNISAIYHAIQERQPPHYQTFKNLKRGNVRDVRDM